ncbi:GIY-YIG nuclease family protein, partial [Ohtaekwangia sp.]|uniref:GIY-YIG nuclease family protein n=1 Tax=Ohtaekwangia sp. TaxID=2066019 RepID=UPI0039C99D50
MSHCVYILFSVTINRFYIGMTEDIQKRIFQHNNPIHNSKFTAKGVSWELFIAIPCEDKQHAL